MESNNNAIILQSLQELNQHFGTIATVNENGQPEAATMYFLNDENLDLYFITRSGSRKFANLSKNGKAAFVVSGQHPSRTIQFEGTVSEVMDPVEQTKYYEQLSHFLFQSYPVPPVSQIVGGEMVLMKFETSWVRLGDFQEMKEGDKFVEYSK